MSTFKTKTKKINPNNKNIERLQCTSSSSDNLTNLNRSLRTFHHLSYELDDIDEQHETPSRSSSSSSFFFWQFEGENDVIWNVISWCRFKEKQGQRRGVSN